MSTTITTPTGVDIANLIGKLDPVLRDHPLDVVIASCFAIIFVSQHPEINTDELTAGIDGASRWVTDFIDSTSTAKASNPDQLSLPFPSSMLPN